MLRYGQGRLRLRCGIPFGISGHHGLSQYERRKVYTVGRITLTGDGIRELRGCLHTHIYILIHLDVSLFLIE